MFISTQQRWQTIKQKKAKQNKYYMLEHKQKAQNSKRFKKAGPKMVDVFMFSFQTL